MLAVTVDAWLVDELAAVGDDDRESHELAEG
jgi:hypothetical protein